VGKLAHLRQQRFHLPYRLLIAQMGHQGIADIGPAGGQAAMGQVLQYGRMLRIKAVGVEGVLPDQGGGPHQGTRLKDHARDLERVEHLQARGVVAAQAIVEADDHPKAVWAREMASAQIGEGEKLSPPGQEKSQFLLQLLGGDRRHAVAIQEGDPAGRIHSVIQQAEDLAFQPLAPEGARAGHEQQIQPPVGHPFQQRHQTRLPRAATPSSALPTSRSPASRAALWVR
jgi:hypothetical protein